MWIFFKRAGLTSTYAPVAIFIQSVSKLIFPYLKQNVVALFAKIHVASNKGLHSKCINKLTHIFLMQCVYAAPPATCIYADSPGWCLFSRGQIGHTLYDLWSISCPFFSHATSCNWFVFKYCICFAWTLTTFIAYFPAGTQKKERDVCRMCLLLIWLTFLLLK